MGECGAKEKHTRRKALTNMPSVLPCLPQFIVLQLDSFFSSLNEDRIVSSFCPFIPEILKIRFVLFSIQFACPELVMKRNFIKPQVGTTQNDRGSMVLFLLDVAVVVVLGLVLSLGPISLEASARALQVFTDYPLGRHVRILNLCVSA